MPLETAIFKMTCYPAQRLGLKDRGRIASGLAADLVVFDPERITDHATYTEPRQYPSGISFVMVYGQMVVESGRHTGARSGKVLLRAGRTV